MADSSEAPLVVEQENGWLLDASISLEQLEELLDIKLEREESDYFTLAGLLLEQLQHIPVSGESLVITGYEFEIEVMEGRRIQQVRVTALKSAEERET